MLDVRMTRNDNNRISTDVYRKPTHTDHYLQWNSNHPVQQKIGIVRTLVHRAKSIIQDPVLLEKEINKIKEDLTHCGYPKWALKEGLSVSRRERTVNQNTNGTDKPKRSGYVVLPYMKGTTERLKRAYAKHNISLFSKPGYTLRNALVRPKDPLEKEEKCGVVYKIDCGVCQATYIGETERSLASRIPEHQKSVDINNSKSALSQHQVKTGHVISIKPLLECTEIIDSDNLNPHRKAKETIHRKLKEAELNRTDSFEIPDAYLPLLRQEAGGAQN